MAQAPVASAQLSPETLQLAANYPIGTPLAEHKTGFSTSIKVSLSVIGAFGLLFIVMSLPNLSGRIVLLLTGLVLTAFGVWAYLAPVVLKRRIIVGSDGFAYLNGQNAEVVRWSDIETFQRYVMNFYILVFRFTTTHNYTIKTRSGKKYSFKDIISDVEMFGNHVDRMVAQYQIPQAIAAYNAGSAIPFKNLTVSQQGIQKGGSLVPWQEVLGVYVKQERYGSSAGLLGLLLREYIGPYGTEFLTIERPKGFMKGPIRLLVSSVPNVTTFLALVKHASGGRL